MPPQTRIRSELQAELTLPPLFTPVRLRELGDAFAHAQMIAGEMGAGTLVHVGRFDLAEFAVVLEPTEPLSSARLAFYAGMAATAEALAAHAPPEMPVEIRWPDALTVNGGLVGGGRLAWPQGTHERDMPDWLVFGAMIRTASSGGVESGLYPQVTSLDEEGFDESTVQAFIETFARHLLLIIHTMQHEGFTAVAKPYLSRMARVSGIRRELADNGDLRVRPVASNEIKRHGFVQALVNPSWLDQTTGGIRMSV